ncbi:WhiB family transcriptional regulator [Streptomyces sp. G3]|nr:WhiB family transcriptional regulator [Streptomyces sp. G3]
MCAPCAYRGPCAEYAIGDPTLQGVWGGLTTRDRRALRRAGVADETPAAA